MGGKIKLRPCCGHDNAIAPTGPSQGIRAFHTQDNYFDPVHPGIETDFLGTEDAVYEFLGAHIHRGAENDVCIKDILTGETFDLSTGWFDQLLHVRKVWTRLGEMEALAWSSKLGEA